MQTNVLAFDTTVQLNLIQHFQEGFAEVGCHEVAPNFGKMDKDLLTDRQAIGIAKARAKGKYKGRKALPATIINKANKLIAKGMKKKEVARQLNIGESTLYKYLAAQRQKD